MEGNTDFNNAKRPSRRQVLDKKKTIDGLLKSASSLQDPLASFPAYLRYNANGLSAHLESGRGDKLSNPIKQRIQNLLKLNMEGHYGSEWAIEEKVKRKEMAASEARYIFVHELPDSRMDSSSDPSEQKGSFVGFVHYRFTLEEELPVIYLYELQLVPRAHGKGLGKFLMQLLEMIASKNGMAAIMLTVQKANLSALNFYISKLRYVISSTSPSRVDPLSKTKKNYEILVKSLTDEAKFILE